MSGNLLSYSSAFGGAGNDDNTLAAPVLGGGAQPAPTLVAPQATATPTAATPSAAPNGYASGIAEMESGGRPNAENPYFPVSRGGPLGPHQFIASTWNSFAAANPSLFAGMTPEQVLAARRNPELSAKATQWYAAQNAPILQGHGILPTPGNLGIAHALGPQGAVGVLGYPDATPLAQAFKETQPSMADAILAQNPTYRDMTVGQLKQKYAKLDGGQYMPVATAPQAQVAVAAPPAAPNALSSLVPFSGANLAAMTPYQRLAAMQQLQGLFAPHRAAQSAQAGGGGPMTGGVDASIPLAAGRVA
jgi:hypothetical protein